jgi:hypothetical protein
LFPTGLALSVPALATLTLGRPTGTAEAYWLPLVSQVSPSGAVATPGNLAVAANPGIDNEANFELDRLDFVMGRDTRMGSIAASASAAVGTVGVPFKVDTTATWTNLSAGRTAGTSGIGYHPVVELSTCGDPASQSTIPGGQSVSGEAWYVCLAIGGDERVDRVYASARDASGDCRYMGVEIDIDCATNSDLGSVPDTQMVGERVVVMTLEIGGKLYPRNQFTLGSGGSCTEDQWHANGSVYPVANADTPWDISADEQAGISDPAPTGCGFGKASELVQRPVVTTTGQWGDFMANHN